MQNSSKINPNGSNFVLVPLVAETVGHVGKFGFTNSLVNAVIVTIVFCGVALVTFGEKSITPTGLNNFVEFLVEALLKQAEKVTGSKAKARAFFPLVATIFLFVLANNWFGLLPGVSTIGIWQSVHGVTELVPILRSAGSDLNFTLAIALLAVVISHVAGLRSQGFFSHANKFVNIKGIWKSLRKGPMAIFLAFIEFGVGIIELIGEFSKVLSLSLRLFGNVFAGEILMTVMLSLVSYVVPVPFMFFELIVGVVQATVFSILTLVYLTIATTGHDKHDEKHDAHSNASSSEASAKEG